MSGFIILYLSFITYELTLSLVHNLYKRVMHNIMYVLILSNYIIILVLTIYIVCKVCAQKVWICGKEKNEKN